MLPRLRMQPGGLNNHMQLWLVLLFAMLGSSWGSGCCSCVAGCCFLLYHTVCRMAGWWAETGVSSNQGILYLF